MQTVDEEYSTREISDYGDYKKQIVAQSDETVVIQNLLLLDEVSSKAGDLVRCFITTI